MKIKQIAAIALSIILIAGCPFSAFALDNGIEQGLEGSEITCTVQEIYDFSVPDDAEITFPKTSEYLGDFVVGNILLKSNETLRLNLNIGMLSKTDDNNSVITYDVIFNAPGEIDKTKIGSAYGIGVSIDPDEFEDADPGTYRAPLNFQVVSNISGEVVWEQNVYLEAVKNSSGQQHQSNDNEDNDEEESIGDTSDSIADADKEAQDQSVESETNKPVPATIDDESEGDSVDNGAAIGFTDEETPLGNSGASNKLLLWVLIACGGVTLIVLLFLFIRSRKRNIET